MTDSLIDNPQSLAERVKRLREQSELVPAFKESEAYRTINDLVNLVGEMRENLRAWECIYTDKKTPEDGLAEVRVCLWYATIKKINESAPIAALAKEKV